MSSDTKQSGLALAVTTSLDLVVEMLLTIYYILSCYACFFAILPRRILLWTKKRATDILWANKPFQ